MSVNNSDSPVPRCDSDASRLSGSNEVDKKIPNFKIMSLNIFSLLPHLDKLRMLVDNDKLLPWIRGSKTKPRHP